MDPLPLANLVEDKYPTIRKNVRFSMEVRGRVEQALAEELGDPKAGDPAVLATGSLARHEASALSDLDYIIVYPKFPDEQVRAQFRDRVWRAISSVMFRHPAGHEISFQKPNPVGVFAEDEQASELYGAIGSSKEKYNTISRRLLILLESKAIWNRAYANAIVGALVDAYGRDVKSDPTKHFVLLLNDLIRYFRQLAVNYHAVKEANSDGKWPIRNVKLRHSRVLMYASLLACLGELSKPEYARREKLTELKLFIDMTPLERFATVYQENDDDNLFRLLGLYDVFLERLSDPQARDLLRNLEYEGRYDDPLFAALKANSDAFGAEITRFVYARRGTWSDRFYEYLII